MQQFFILLETLHQFFGANIKFFILIFINFKCIQKKLWKIMSSTLCFLVLVILSHRIHSKDKLFFFVSFFFFFSHQLSPDNNREIFLPVLFGAMRLKSTWGRIDENEFYGILLHFIKIMMLKKTNNKHTEKIKSISGIYDGINFPNRAFLCRQLSLIFILQED